MKRTTLILAVVALLGTAPNRSWGGLISDTNSVPGNFDASSGDRTVIFTGAEAGFDTGIITGATISINFAKADGGAFDPPYPGGTPFYNEIHFHLTSPMGTVVHLIEPGSWGSGSGQFDGTIVFDDSAAQVVNFGAAPVAGTFRPTGPGALADFNGELAAGNWTLFIQDTVGADSLRFREFTLNLTTQQIAAIPEPTSLALFGMFTVSAGYYGWRRRKPVAMS